MVDGCKHEVNAEADMLDILWSYCVSERAAGYAYVCAAFYLLLGFDSSLCLQM